MKHGKVSISISCGFFLDQILAKRDHEIAGSEAHEESSISYKSTSRSNKVSFTSIKGKGDYKSDRVTSCSFDGWIYSSKALRCSC